MNYFAYGSNVNLDHFTDYLSTHGVTIDTELQAEAARLEGYALRTNYFAGSHRAGACNIEPAPGHHVEGVIITITTAIQEILRVKEGHPRRYEEIEVEVHTASTQAPVRALTYVVTPEHRLDLAIPVTNPYRILILTGATDVYYTNSNQ